MDFWRERPRAGLLRAASLLVPAVLSAVGFFAFAVLAYSFVELDTLPPSFRRWLVLIGAFAIAAGSEIGTLANTVEIFRKHGAGETRTWDWLGFGVSVVTTLVAFVFSWAALLHSETVWSGPLRLWGPVALGALAALDSYANFAELGLYIATVDIDLRAWRTDRDDERYRRWREGLPAGKPRFKLTDELGDDMLEAMPCGHDWEHETILANGHLGCAICAAVPPGMQRCPDCGAIIKAGRHALAGHSRWCEGKE